jgi:serine kinase of HPr protein (carbohydrate metabolism regulator)
VIRHAGLVAQREGGRWRGALIEGPSGAGKSDLAIRAMDAGLRLVADDRVLVWVSGGRLYGRAPDPLAGLIEVRGQGVVRATAVPFAEVVMVARLGAPDRTPESRTENVLGIEIPLLDVAPFESSAAAKLGRAIGVFAAAHKGRM